MIYTSPKLHMIIDPEPAGKNSMWWCYKLVGYKLDNHGTSANKSSIAESSWRLNELTDGAVKI